MCRFLLYQGDRAQPLSTFLKGSPHALVEQALSPRELHPSLPSADGWGVIWYSEGEVEPGGYHSVIPMWRDQNLHTLTPHVSSRQFLASTRVATGTSELTITNNQPFVSGPIAFAHNGTLEDFEGSFLLSLRSLISAEHQTVPRGVTDSAHLFALLLDYLDAAPDLSLAVDRLVATIAELSSAVKRPVSMNLLVSDGSQGVALRYATLGKTPPSLHWQQMERSVVIASEPLDDEAGWSRVKPNVRMTLRGGELVDLRQFS